MPLARRRLSWMIHAWLFCQVAGLAAAPFALHCEWAMSADRTPACCQGLAPGQTCPMHHKDDADRTCKMRSACSRSDAALLTLAGGLGVLPAATISVIAFAPGATLQSIGMSVALHAERPEPPPPRG